MKRYPIKFKTGFETKDEHIPYAMMLEHESQCKINHGKTVDKLVQKGGTSYLDTYFILKDQRFNMYMEEDDMEKLETRAKNLVQAMAYRWLMTNGALNQIDI